MATVYSSNYSTGTYTYTRVRVNYSGTSATATLLWSRTNSPASSSTTGSPATFTFAGQTVSIAGKSYYGGPYTDVAIGSVEFTIPTSGGTYSGSTSGSVGLFGFSGSVTIPSQVSTPNEPFISASVEPGDEISITYGTTAFNGSSPSITLYGGIDPDNLVQLETGVTTGNHTFTLTGLTRGTTYYFKATASNSQYSSSSDTISAVLRYGLPPKFYGSVNGDTTKTTKLYGPVNGQATTITKLYGSVNGQTKRIF